MKDIHTKSLPFITLPLGCPPLVIRIEAASLKTLPRKPDGTKPWLRKKEYIAYLLPLMITSLDVTALVYSNLVYQFLKNSSRQCVSEHICQIIT